MSISLSAGIPARIPTYQPRHSSTRQAPDGSGRLAQGGRVKATRHQASRPEPSQPVIRLAELVNASATPDLLDGLTDRQLRSLLEACTRDRYVRAVPELAYLIAHPSHTSQTLTQAWEDFRRCTREAAAYHGTTRYWREFFGDDLDATAACTAEANMASLADEAWQVIVNGAGQRRPSST